MSELIKSNEFISVQAGWSVPMPFIRFTLISILSLSMLACEGGGGGEEGGDGGGGDSGSPVVSASRSTISGTGPVPADGVAESTITIVLRTITNQPAAGFVPTFLATDTNNLNTYGACTTSDSQGISTCTLRSQKAEIKNLAITSPVTKVGDTVEFSSGVATQLKFTLNPPLTATVNQPFSAGVEVEIQTSAGTKVTTPNHVVTISAFADSSCIIPAGGVLTVDANPTASNAGTAEFTGLQYDTVSSIYLRATAPGLSSDCSLTATNVQPGTPVPANSSITGTTPIVADGVAASIITIYLRDASGVGVQGLIPTFSATDSGASNSYTVCSATDVTGYSTCELRSTTAEAKTLALLTPISKTGDVVTFAAGPATEIVWSVAPPLTASADVLFGTQPVARVLDAFGNSALSSNVPITLAAYTDAGCSISAGGTFTVTTNPVSTVSALASFAGVKYAPSGNIYIGASSPGLTPVCAATATDVQSGLPDPANSTIVGSGPVVANGVATTTVTITLRDANNIGVPGETPTFSATDTGATNSYAACSVSDVSGVSTCTFTSTRAEVKTLSLVTPIAMAGGTVTFNAGAPAKLFFSTEPSTTGTAGVDLAQPPTVEVRDAFDNISTSPDQAITLAAFTNAGCTVAASGSLSASQNPLTSTSGQSAFTNVNYNQAENIYLQASSGGLTTDCSTAINLSAGAPDAANSTITGSGPATADGVDTSTVTITLRDANNVGIPGLTPTFTATDAGSTNVYGSCSATTMLGVSTCTFTSTKAEIKTLSIATPIVKADGNVTFEAGAAAKLSFATEPSATGTASVNLAQPPVVHVLDAFDNVVTSATNPITLAPHTDAICTVAATGNLSATSNPLSATSGVATFAGVQYDYAENIYIQAAAAGLTPACSQQVVLSAGAPSIANSTITGAGPVVADGVSTSVVTITLRDGNNVGIPGETPTFSATDTGGTNSYDICSVTDIDGISTCTMTSTKAEIKTLSISTPIVKADGTVTFTFGTATTLIFGTQPSNSNPAFVNWSTQPSILVHDAFGNVVTNATTAITLAAFDDDLCTTPAGGTLSATANPLSATAGVSTFAGVQYDVGSTIYIGASGGGLTEACSDLVTITGGTATAGNSNITGTGPVTANGVATSTVTITLRDINNTGVPGLTPTFSATDTGSTNTYGACSVSDSSGVSTCTLTSTKAETKTLSIATPVSKSDGTVVFQPGAAAKLIFATEPPATNAAGVALSTQPVVQVQDAFDNLVTSSSASVTLAPFTDAGCSAAASGNLSATSNPLSASSGVATFANVSYDEGGTIYIQAESGALTTDCSTAVILTVGGADAGNSNITGTGPVTANGVATSTVTITLKDINNVAVTGVTPTFSATDTGSTNAYGACSATNASGVSTCTLTSTKAEVKTLSIATPIVDAGGTVTYQAGAATQLAFSVAPQANPQALVNFSPQPQVTVQDAFGNTVTGSSASLTLAGFTNVGCTVAASGTLAATSNPLSASSGIATFAGVNYSTAETIYVEASSAGLTPVCSPAVNVAAGAADAANSSITGTGPVTADGVATSTITVVLRDANNVGIPNVVPTFNATDTLSANTYGACGTTDVTGTTTCTLASTKGEVKTLFLLTPVAKTGGTVTFNPGAATQLMYTQQPSTTGTAATNLVQQPRVAVFDVSGNLVTSATNSIALGAYTNATCTTLATGTLAATTNPLSAVAGVSTFAGVNYSKAEAIYLRGSSAGLTETCSNMVTISAGAAANLVLSGPTNTTADTCSTVFTVQVQDANGNNTTVSPSNAINLSNSGSGVFYASAGNCASQTSPVSSVTIPNNQGSVSFYFRSTVAGGYVIDADDDNAVIASGSFNTTIDPGAGATLVFATQPSSTATSNEVLGVQPVIEVQDSFGNLATSSADPITLDVYTDAACTTPAVGILTATTNPLNATSGVATFAGVTYDTAETIYIGATSGSLTETCSDPIDVSALLTITANDVTVNEWGVATVTATLSSPPGSAVTVDYYTQDQTAVAGTDYETVSGTLTFDPGITTARIYIPLHHDLLVDAAETFRVQFANPSGAVMPDDIAVVTITDNDFAAKTDFSSIAAKADSTHVCGINTSGGVECWGAGGNGRLGNSASSNVARPVQVTGLTSGVTKIATSVENTCAIVSGGAKCWGRNNYSEVGDATTTSRTAPTDVTGHTSNVSDISIGTDHTCLITSAGAARCWGRGSNGRLGNSSTANQTASVQVTGLTTGVAEITLGTTFSCARLTSGQVRCWGAGSNGQMGNNTTTGTNSAPVTTLFGGATLTGVATIAAGSSHVCVTLTTSGNVRCWGLNSSGQIGDGTTTQRTQAVNVAGVTGVTKLSLGNAHTCALTSTGEVYCWGSATTGALGDGTTANKTTPTLISALGTDNTDLATGTSFTCVRKSSGKVQCVGDASVGRLGNNFFGHRQHAVNGNNLTPSDVTQMSMGQDHMCLIDGSGAVKCFGLNTNGQIGDTTTNTPRLTPTTVSGLGSGATQISLGTNHSCALTSAGQVRCWGLNSNGQLGDNSTTSRSTPVTPVASGGSDVSAGGAFTCAVVSGGAKCWGLNTSSQLGDGSVTQRNAPVDVTGLTSGVAQVAAGSTFACARLTTNAVSCWGSNTYGQLGDGTTTPSSTPVSVTGLSDALFIRAGQFHICALRATGAVTCWGRGNSGQMGNGTTTTNNTTPTTPTIITNDVSQLTVGLDHVCVRLSSGELRCWGAGANGALGFNSTGNRTSPSLPSQIPAGVSDVYAGHQHTCASMTDGRFLCWGRNFASEFQDGINQFTWSDVLQ